MIVDFQKTLNTVVQEAYEGNVIALAVVFVHKNGETCSSFAWLDGNRMQLLASMELVKLDIADSIRKNPRGDVGDE